MDELAENHTVSEEKYEVVRTSIRGQGRVAAWDHFELIEPRDALLPEGLHAGHWR